MAMDPDIVNQLNTAHARSVVAAAGVDVQNSQLMQQLGAQIAVAAEYDQRLLNGFLASQLFNLDVVQAKTAYDTPHPPGTAPATAQVNAATPAAGS